MGTIQMPKMGESDEAEVSRKELIERAEREIAVLRDFRNTLEPERTEEETSIRTSLLGRND